mmetsp:Transcript_5584/g.14226  ORF Transcript_5584/g.14226 Transcript_5584/m.14226 type:complete len:80 (-) Transcript_5584:633-872(-)
MNTEAMTSRIVFNCASTDRMSALVSLTTSVAVTLHAAPSAVAAKKGNGSESIVLTTLPIFGPSMIRIPTAITLNVPGVT